MNDIDYPILCPRRLGAPTGAAIHAVEIHTEVDVFRDPDGTITIKPREQSEVIFRDEDDTEWSPGECVFVRDQDETE